MPLDRVLALGAEDYVGGDPSKFNMAVMGFRLGQRANGVSLLHGAVSREMFQGLWPAFDTSEVPITSITNGVHHLTWVHRDLLELLERPTGSLSETVVDGFDWAALEHVDAKTIWELTAQDAPGADPPWPGPGWPRAAPTAGCRRSGSATS